MSTHSQHDQNLQPEGSGIKARPILMFMIILGVSTAATFVIVKGVLWGLVKMEDMNPQTPATMVRESDKRRLPPAPRLQGAPGEDSTDTKDVLTPLPLEDMKNYSKELDKKITSYGLVKDQPGVAHISIERAKELIAEKGLPMLPEKSISEIQRAAETRKAVMNAGSNGGRLIKSQKVENGSQ
jgi:hypothetical protein